MDEYFARLGLCRGASNKEVRKAYKEALLRVHPDKGGSHEEFLAINEAYEYLCAHLDSNKDTEHECFVNDVACLIRQLYESFAKQEVTKKLLVEVHVTTSLTEVYMGCVKKLQYKAFINGCEVHKSILIDLSRFQPTLCFTMAGDEQHGMAGDLLVHVDVVECGMFRIDTVLPTPELFAEMSVSLYKFLIGGEVHVALPDGDTYTLCLPPLQCISKNHHVYIHHAPQKGLLTGEGRGNLIIVLEVDMSAINMDFLSDQAFCMGLQKYFA